MQVIYYKSSIGNFGDDLNIWLWPKIFDLSLFDPDSYFIGIGSILYNENENFRGIEKKNKIVFGTGIRPSYNSFVLDKTWDIKFLRGPLSSYALANKYEYIADAAYAIRLIDNFHSIRNIDKKYEVSVMPYFRSVKYFDWESICKKLGYNYISPFAELGVEHTIREIASSKHIITEAMHGAIIADALRVPWNRFILTTPFTEGQMVSEFKWMDWMFSIGINLPTITHIKYFRKSFINRVLRYVTSDSLDVNFLIKRMVKDDITKQLAKVNNYNLSSETQLQIIDERMLEKIENISQKEKLKV